MNWSGVFGVAKLILQFPERIFVHTVIPSEKKGAHVMKMLSDVEPCTPLVLWSFFSSSMRAFQTIIQEHNDRCSCERNDCCVPNYRLEHCSSGRFVCSRTDRYIDEEVDDGSSYVVDTCKDSLQYYRFHHGAHQDDINFMLLFMLFLLRNKLVYLNGWFGMMNFPNNNYASKIISEALTDSLDNGTFPHLTTPWVRSLMKMSARCTVDSMQIHQRMTAVHTVVHIPVPGAYYRRWKLRTIWDVGIPALYINNNGNLF